MSSQPTPPASPPAASPVVSSTASSVLWAGVDHYFNDMLLPPDPVLDATISDSDAAGLPAINVAPNQGKLLGLLAAIQGAERILEVGTLGGYSTIWLARALPVHGRLITIEFEPKHAEVARANIERAGLADRVEVRVGRAGELLPALDAQGQAPFDLVFIDADKPGNPDYFRWALRLSRPGSLIIVDNVVRNGAVIDAASIDPNVKGVRAMLDLIADEPRVSATMLQTVGLKGYDGLLIARVIG